MKLSLNDLGASYVFNTVAKTITFSGLPSGMNIANFLLVVNMTTNSIIFQLGGGNDLGGSFSTNILTLNSDLSGMNNTDKLLIFIDTDWQIKVINPDGSDIGGPLDGYVTANYDTSTSTYYFGKIKSDGSWIIEKLVGGASTFCKGASNYSTNWTNRASLTYVLYSELE